MRWLTGSSRPLAPRSGTRNSQQWLKNIQRLPNAVTRLSYLQVEVSRIPLVVSVAPPTPLSVLVLFVGARHPGSHLHAFSSIRPLREEESPLFLALGTDAQNI